MLDGEASTARAAEALKALLRGPLAPRDEPSARQDSLDLLALFAGLKSVALIGCGYETGAWLAAIADLAAGEGFAVRRGGMPWLVREEFAGLPEWYREPVRQAWEAADLLTVSWPEEAARFAAAPILITGEEEAELLGYPACCVRDHHARRRIYHELMIELIAARCDSLEARRRFVESETMPPLRGEADRRRLQQAVGGEALALAGFVPCPCCERQGSESAAGLLERARVELAFEAGFPAPALVGA